MLWRNGPNDLCVYDCERLVNDETIKDFWTFKGKQTMPIAAVSNREVYKILAISQLDPSTQVLHYMEKDPEYRNVKTEYYMKDVFPSSNLWANLSGESDDDGGVSGREYGIHRGEGDIINEHSSCEDLRRHL
jgi:hypothetical protein